MKVGVRGKLFAASVALILSAGVPAGAFLEAALRETLEARIVSELTRHAGSVRDLLEVAPAGGGDGGLDALADRMGRTCEARVTVIGADGDVLGDSEVDATDLLSIGDHGQRPEVVAARRDGIGLSRRFSNTLRTEMLYVALPLRRQDGVGAVRVAMPLHDVDVAVRRLHGMLLVAGLLGLGVALVMTGLASHLFARQLRHLVASARAMAAGGGARRVPIRSDDELGGIAGSLNRMAEEVEGTVATLASERDLMQAVLEGMADGVVGLDDRHRVTLLNGSAERLLGAPTLALGRPLSDLVRAPALQDLLGQQGGARAEVEFDLPGPQPRRVLARAAPMKVAGGVVLVLRDVTRIRDLETMRRDFVANVSHELRTPVSVIRANAETLVDHPDLLPEKSALLHAAILRNSDRLTHILADLLDLARIEAGEAALQVGRVALAPAARRAVEAVELAARQKGVALAVDGPPDLGVTADGNALDQILLNLLENAIKYTPAGGSVRIGAQAVRGMVRIVVVDTGPGIEPRFRERVFERFFRVDPGRSREIGGTGLGLSIVKNLVEAMGGEVGVAPADGGGSRFWFTLPKAD